MFEGILALACCTVYFTPHLLHPQHTCSKRKNASEAMRFANPEVKLLAELKPGGSLVNRASRREDVNYSSY